MSHAPGAREKLAREVMQAETAPGRLWRVLIGVVDLALCWWMTSVQLCFPVFVALSVVVAPYCYSDLPKD